MYGKGEKSFTETLNFDQQQMSSYLGPVVQSIVSLMSMLVVKMLTVLLSTRSKSQVFLLKICEKLLHLQI